MARRDVLELEFDAVYMYMVAGDPSASLSGVATSYLAVVICFSLVASYFLVAVVCISSLLVSGGCSQRCNCHVVGFEAHRERQVVVITRIHTVNFTVNLSGCTPEGGITEGSRLLPIRCKVESY